MIRLLSLICLILAPFAHGVTDVPVKNHDFADGLDKWANRLDNTEASTVALENGPAATALQLNTSELPDKPWFVQLRQILPTKFYPSERIEISAMVRSPDSCQVSLALQMARPPFSPLIAQRKTLSPEWSKITLRGKLKELIGPRESQITITGGLDAGTIEITDVQMRLLDRDKLSEVPESFAALSWAEDELPIIDLANYPMPTDKALPAGPYRSSVAGLSGFTLQGKQNGSMEQVSVSGQPFTEALRLKTEKPTHKPYGFQVHQKLISTAEKGDTLLAVFSYRVVEPNPETGYGASEFIVEKVGGRYDRAITWGVTADDDQWHHCVIPFTAPFDLPAGGAQIGLRGGYGPQTIEIGGVALINFGADISPEQLPASRMDYIGSAPDAPWRKEAEARIEKHRKGDFTLKLTDAQGKPLAGVKVTGKLGKHLYSFGSAISAPVLLPDGKRHNPEYSKFAETLFNSGELENAMKAKRFNQPGNAEAIEAGLTWMEERGWNIRGHTLVWPGWRYSPPEILKLKNDPDALRAAILEHIEIMCTRYGSRVQDWDVINEPFTNQGYMDVLGQDAMETWVKAARKADPSSRLFVNDFDIVERPGTGNPKIPYYLDMIKRFKENGAELDGMGLQSHFVGSLTPIPHVLEMMDTFADAGVDVQVTELTVNILDEQTQADYARDFITATFSNPATDFVQVWGFWEGAMWESEAAMYRKNWTPKPLAEAFIKLVNETYSTQVNAVTDANGEIHFRGFFGQYNLAADVDGKEQAVQVKYTPETLTQKEVL